MKTWLITGCSSGIGEGIAKAVLEKGDQAIVTARKTEALAKLVAEYPQTCLAVSLELNDFQSIQQAVEKGIDQFGHIDVLVNNAGYCYRSSVEEGEKDGVMSMFQTNFFGVIELIKQVLPSMRQKKSGAIVNVSSIGAVRTGAASGYYAATKAALELMSEGLRAECAPLGIKVMIVEPGSFRTDFYDRSLKGTSHIIADYEETVGPRRKENTVNLKNQPGDPLKAGKVIVETIEKEHYPLRLLLGSDAVKIVTETLKDRLTEIENWADLSQTTDFS